VTEGQTNWAIKIKNTPKEQAVAAPAIELRGSSSPSPVVVPAPLLVFVGTYF